MSAAITEPRRTRSAQVRSIRGLYAITPDLADTRRLVEMVRAAVRGGARVVQYRNKAADALLRREQALALKTALAHTGSLLIVNDDVALAAAIGAHGAHVGEDDADLAAARAAMGDDAIIGVSCYDDIERARTLVEAGADYIAFGSFFPSSVKPRARHADAALLREARTLGVPVVGIGGITAGNAGALRAAGADAVAVISALFGSGDADAIERAARALALAAR